MFCFTKQPSGPLSLQMQQENKPGIAGINGGVIGLLIHKLKLSAQRN